MATPLAITQVHDAGLYPTRSSQPDGWTIFFQDAAGAITYGSIADNANSFSASATGAGNLRIAFTEDTDIISTEEFDILLVQVTLQAGGTRWMHIILPDAIDNGIYYVDTDGRLWAEAGLTTPAAGVASISDALTLTDDTTGTAGYLEVSIEDTETISDSLVDGTVRLSDTVVITEELSTRLNPWDKNAGADITTNWSKNV